jgi:hypothetical protein
MQEKMARQPVFYSFHFSNDVMRVQLIRNIGALDGNNPVNPNEWEKIKRQGDDSVKRWIDDNMKYKRCVIVLVGQETASRKWVQYEIKKAWNDRKPIFGIYIHNLKCARSGICQKGRNPFDQFTLQDGRSLSSIVPCYDPNPMLAYKDISQNIEHWIGTAARRS